MPKTSCSVKVFEDAYAHMSNENVLKRFAVPVYICDHGYVVYYAHVPSDVERNVTSCIAIVVNHGCGNMWKKQIKRVK